METKICTRCKEKKIVSLFSKSAYRKEGTRAQCKDCEREQANAFYHKNPEPYRLRAKAHKKVVAKRIKDFLLSLKQNSGCVLCPEKEVACLDFHHIIKGKNVGHCLSYKGVISELNKCIIVCCNCHRKIHAKLLKVDKTFIKQVSVDMLKK